MDAKTKETKQLFKICIDKIIAYCLTHKLSFDNCQSVEEKENISSLEDLKKLYLSRFLNIFEKHKESILNSLWNSSTLLEFIECISILSALKDDSLEKVHILISDTLFALYDLHEDEDANDPRDEMCIGTCCICKGECNLMSQSCGSCARGLSGVALGLPTPDHILEFLL